MLAPNAAVLREVKINGNEFGQSGYKALAAVFPVDKLAWVEVSIPYSDSPHDLSHVIKIKIKTQFFFISELHPHVCTCTSPYLFQYATIMAGNYFSFRVHVSLAVLVTMFL